MRILGLDIGRRHTGVALLDQEVGFPLALDTLQHAGDEKEVVADILQVCDERGASVLVLGLPLLPSGQEGSQVTFVRSIGDALTAAGLTVEYLDERYTTNAPQHEDGDAKAACEILRMYLARSHNKGIDIY